MSCYDTIRNVFAPYLIVAIFIIYVILISILGIYFHLHTIYNSIKYSCFMEIDIDPLHLEEMFVALHLLKRSSLKKNILENPQELDNDDIRTQKP